MSHIYFLENTKVMTDDESASSSAITVVSAATTSALRKGVKDRGGGGGSTFPSNLSSYVAGALEVAENQVGSTDDQ